MQLSKPRTHAHLPCMHANTLISIGVPCMIIIWAVKGMPHGVSTARHTHSRCDGVRSYVCKNKCHTRSFIRNVCTATTRPFWLFGRRSPSPNFSILATCSLACMRAICIVHRSSMEVKDHSPRTTTHIAVSICAHELMDFISLRCRMDRRQLES